MATKRLTLYGRGYCHLCHDMELALGPLSKELGFDFDAVDVDADPVLEERLGELVPVLMAEDRELCHYHLDVAAVRAFMAEIG
jgi:hypothetical protein